MSYGLYRIIGNEIFLFKYYFYEATKKLEAIHKPEKFLLLIVATSARKVDTG